MLSDSLFTYNIKFTTLLHVVASRMTYSTVSHTHAFQTLPSAADGLLLGVLQLVNVPRNVGTLNSLTRFSTVRPAHSGATASLILDIILPLLKKKTQGHVTDSSTKTQKVMFIFTKQCY